MKEPSVEKGNKEDLGRALDDAINPFRDTLQKAMLGTISKKEPVLSPGLVSTIGGSKLLTGYFAGMRKQQITAVVPIIFSRYMNPVTSEVSRKIRAILASVSTPEGVPPRGVDQIERFMGFDSMSFALNEWGRILLTVYGRAPSGEKKLSDEELDTAATELAPHFQSVLSEYTKYFFSTLRTDLVARGHSFSDEEYEKIFASEMIPMLNNKRQKDWETALIHRGVPPKDAREIMRLIVESAQNKFDRVRASIA